MGLERHVRLIESLNAIEPEAEVIRMTSRIGLVRRLKLVQALLDHDDLADCDYVYTRELEAACQALIDRAEAGEYDHREDAADNAYYREITK